MKIVIAPDSFKGSLSSEEVGFWIKKGINEIIPNANVVCVPIADGGEGTLDAICKKDQIVSIKASSPNFSKIDAEYGILGDTAVIEMAKTAGLTILPENLRVAKNATTLGVGESIMDAFNKGIRNFLITAGGSATNDGGAGLLSALGGKFFDENKREFIPTGKNLSEIKSIDTSGIDKELLSSKFTIATDVKNPLLGKYGATNVYAKQKGATEEDLILMEKGMQNYANVIKDACKKDVSIIEGSGAGGGVAVPLLAFFDGKITSGINAILDAINFSDIIKDADIIITGEGKIDRQSLFGKAISGVCDRAKEKNIPVYCFVGGVGDKKEELLKMGIKDIYAVVERAKDLSDAMSNAKEYLRDMAKDFAKVIKGESL